jgi:hypothetical protein
LLLTFLFVIVSPAALGKRNIRIEYVYGGLHDEIRLGYDDVIVRGLAEGITGDPNDGVVLNIGLEGLGHTSKSDVVDQQLEEVDSLTCGSVLIKVGYSSGGGAVVDLPMARNVTPDVTEAWAKLLQAYSDKDIGLVLAVLDPFLGDQDVVPLVDAMQLVSEGAISEGAWSEVGAWGEVALPLIREQHITSMEKFLEDPNHRVTIISFDKKDYFLGPLCDIASRELKEVAEKLSEEVASRYVFLNEDSDVSAFWEDANPLGSLAHPDAKESVPFAAATIRHYCPAVVEAVNDDLARGVVNAYSDNDGSSRPSDRKAMLMELLDNGMSERDAVQRLARFTRERQVTRREPQPPSNQGPTFNSTEKSEQREVYASRGGRYGDLFLMDPSWAHRGCFTVTDPDGDELEIYLGSAPMYGEAGVVYSGAEGEYTATVTYVLPLEEILAAHYGEGVIEDFFTIVAQDPEGEMDEATISLIIEVVNRGVSAGADAAVTDAGMPVIIDVLTNDSDQDGDPLFIESVGRAAYGTVEILGNEVEYTPQPGFCCGIDGFAYLVTDRCGSEATGVVAVLVVDSEAPVLICPENIDVETRDPLGKVVTFTVTATDNCDPVPDVVCIPSSGSQFPIGTTLVVCVGADMCGNMEGCAFEVTVGLKNRPPVALNDYAFLGEDGVLIPVLENDRDPDGDMLTIVWVSKPFHGRAQIVGNQILYTTTTPLPCWPGDTFDYTVDDGHGGQATATVKVKKPVVEDSARMENSSGSWLTSLLIAQWEALLSPPPRGSRFFGKTGCSTSVRLTSRARFLY